MVRRESSRPFSSWRWRRARASLILRASRATTAFICATSSGDSAKSGLSVRTSRVSFSPCAVGAALQLALHVLADHAAEGLEAQVEVVADAREHARVEALGLQQLHDAARGRARWPPSRTCRRCGARSSRPAGSTSAARARRPGPGLADGHLHVAALARAACSSVSSSSSRSSSAMQPVEHLLDARVLGAERLLEPRARAPRGRGSRGRRGGRRSAGRATP